MAERGLRIYQYGEFSWNVYAAIKIVESRSPEPQNITRWFAKLPIHTINEAHWPTVDLLEPLVMVPLYGTGEIWLIDGWHRARKAQAEGIAVLPIHVLSAVEERQVRGYGGDKPS